MTADDWARPRRVLIVEDDEGLRNLTLKALHKAGYEADSVASGAAALERVKADPGLALLLDHRLPDMTGRDIINALQEHGLQIPFIVMTGQGDERLAVEMMRLGAADYLVKTLELVELLPGVFQRMFRELEYERWLRDIELKLRESEERYRLLFTESSEAITLTIPEKGFVGGNPAAIRLFACRDEEDFTSRTPASLSPEYQPDGVLSEEKAREMMQIAMENGSHFFEWTHRKADGTDFPATVFLSRIVKNGTRVLQATVRDITEQKRAEAGKENMKTQNRQLQKEESLDRMAGAIAHTFNNQLGVVIGNLELALQVLPQGVEPVNRLTRAMQAANKAAEVSRQMLTYIGKSSDKQELMDLAEACCWLLLILEASMPENVTLETSLPYPGPVVKISATDIQQVLTNLITNAWEAVGVGGGAIHLSVKTFFPADIPAVHRYPIDWQPQDFAYACLEVADTGSGIADKDLEKLFDPFFSSKFIGRGLGLSVVLGILKAHGGAITVESKLDRGSAFRVFLPVSEEELSRQTDQTAAKFASL